jgi:hypothetical protein
MDPSIKYNLSPLQLLSAEENISLKRFNGWTRGQKPWFLCSMSRANPLARGGSANLSNHGLSQLKQING